MIHLMYEAYGMGMAIATAVALVLTMGTIILTAIYFREDIRSRMSHKLNLFLFGFEGFADEEDKCPEWADEELWKESLR